MRQGTKKAIKMGRCRRSRISGMNPFHELVRRPRTVSEAANYSSRRSLLFQWTSYSLAVMLRKAPLAATLRAMIQVSAFGRHIMKQRLLLIAAMVLGIIAVRYLLLIPGWMKQRRENRQFIAVNNLTPDRLIARCGQPLTDQTKDLYPMVARDLSYKSNANETVVFKFSKTAEESSDWV